jgi:flagellin-like hook-associated protein FlgL
MGISINTNIAATRAGVYLGANHANLQKSLDRLSSGKRITEPADDAGGLAVSMKLEHTSKVLRGTSYNISNAISLLQVQDGILKSAADIVSRMGELKSMSMDVTKNPEDIALYNSEFSDLQSQLFDLSQTEFNGIALFDQDGQTKFKDNTTPPAVLDAEELNVTIAEDGTTFAIHQSSLLPALSLKFDITVTAGVGSISNHSNDDVLWNDDQTGVDHTSDDDGDGTALNGTDDGTGFTNEAAGTDLVRSLAVDTATAGNKLELGDLDQESFTHILQNVAELRAVNGGQGRRLQYALANVETQITNITAANGRIMDVDIAAESSNLARQQVLVQASAAMTAQANVANDVALMLLQ